MADEAADLSPSRPKKKLPFKRTAAPRQTSTPRMETAEEKDDGIDLFRRREEMLPKIEADQKRKLKQKAKVKDESTPRRSSAHGRRQLNDGEGDEDFWQDATRRRPSESFGLEEDELGGRTTPGGSFRDVSSPPSKRSRRDSGSPTLAMTHSPTTRRPASSNSAHTPHRKSAGNSTVGLAINPGRTKPSLPSANIISLDSDSDDASRRPKGEENGAEDSDLELFEIPTSTRLSADDLDGDIDLLAEEKPPIEEEWMQKYLDKARENKARHTAQMQGQKNSPALDSVSTGGGLNGSGSQQSASAQVDPEAIIFITSPIEGTKGVRIRRRISQTMRVVREAWIERQRQAGLAFSAEQAAKVFLTWKGNRLYTTTTLLSLGITPAAATARNLYSVSGGSTDGFSPGWEEIHMEAWDEDLYVAEQARRDRERRLALGEIDEDDEERVEANARTGAAGAARDGGEDANQEKVRVILKAKDFESLRATVYPLTSMDTLVLYFRQQYQVPSSKEVILMFDGERLEEHMTIEEAEISDLDSLDVIVK